MASTTEDLLLRDAGALRHVEEERGAAPEAFAGQVARGLEHLRVGIIFNTYKVVGPLKTG